MYVTEGHSVAHKEELLLLHWADMWMASVRERLHDKRGKYFYKRNSASS